MIASLSGSVLAVSAGTAVIDVGGVGMEIQATPNTLAALRVGEQAHVHTSLVVREDSLTLFGFECIDERDVFNILLGVSGIGPRTALTVLSVLPPDELRSAVTNKNEAALTRVPGIGKKGAQRLILEIGTKLGPALGAGANGADAGRAQPIVVVDQDVVAALVGLGWPEKLASEATAQARANGADAAPSVAELLKNSLRILGSRR